MYTFFDQAGSASRRALAVAGSLIITVVLMASAIVPASPSILPITGALA